MEEIKVLAVLPTIVLVCVVAYFIWRGLKHLWFKEGLREQAELKVIKSLRGKGIEPFAEAWVLTLSTEVPRFITTLAPATEFQQQLELHYRRVTTAVKFFPDGKYLVSCDGTMRKIGNGETELLSAHMQVTAIISVEELPFVDVVQRQVAGKPMNFVEAKKKCILLNVHAHGTARKGNRLRFHCTPQFAARDGKIIVESI